MPKCVNDHHVTADYLRVMWPDDKDQAPACPRCDDVIPDLNGGVREPRSPRSNE